MNASRWRSLGRWPFLLAKTVLIVAVVSAVILLLYRLRSIVNPLLFALLAAYFLTPVVDALSARRVPRAIASALVILLAVVVVALLLLLLIPTLAEQGGAVVRKVPEFVKWLGSAVLPWLGERFGLDATARLDALVAEAKAHASDALAPAGRVLGGLFQGIAGLARGLLALLLTVLFSYFFLVDYHRIVAGARDLVPPRLRPAVSDVAAKIDKVLGAFVRGQITVCCLLAVYYSAGLLLVGVPGGLALGVLTGVLILIPYLGVVTGLVLSLLGAAMDGGVGAVAGVAVVYGGGQVLEGLILTPKIVGGKVGLPPVAVVIAVLVWGELLGLLGVLLAVPATAVLAVLLREGIEKYRQSIYYSEGCEDGEQASSRSGAGPGATAAGGTEERHVPTR